MPIDVRSHQLPGQWGLNVLQLQLREAGPLQGLPALSGKLAAVEQKEPGRIQDLLPEVIPGGTLSRYVFHEVKRPSLRERDAMQGF